MTSKLYEKLLGISDNKDFKEVSQNFETENVESVVFEIEPEGAQSLDEVDRVKVIQKVSGHLAVTFERVRN